MLGRRRVPACHAARARARRSPDRAGRLRARGPRSGRRRAVGARRAARASRGDRLRARGRDRRPHRGPDRRSEGPRHLRGAGGGDRPARPPGAREARRDDPPEPVKPGLERQWAYLVLRGAVVGAAARRPRRVHAARQRAGHRHDRHQALQGLGPRRHPRVAERDVRPVAGVIRGVRRAVLQQASPGFIELWSLQSRMAHQLRARNNAD